MNAAVKPKKRAVESTLIRRLELCEQYLMLPKAQRSLTTSPQRTV